MSEYIRSVPGQTCFNWKEFCIENHANDPEAQSRCNDFECPTKIAALRNNNSDTSEASQTTVMPTIASSQIKLTTSTTTESSSTTAESVTFTAVTAPESTELSPGKKAGIGVGIAGFGAVILGLALPYFLRRKSRGRSTLPGPTAEESKRPTNPEIYHGIQVVDPEEPSLYQITSRGDGIYGLSPAEMPGNHGHRASPQNNSLYELDSRGCLHSNELSSNPTIKRRTQEPQTMPPTTEVAAIPPTTEGAHTPASSGLSPPPKLPTADISSQLPTLSGSQDAYSRLSFELPSDRLSLSPLAGAGSRFSAHDIERLEEEERRIDNEIQQIERVRELSEQKLEIQRRLLEAKR